MSAALAQLSRILSALPDADRAFVLGMAPAWLRREWRLEQRDEAVRSVARAYELPSARAIAEQLRRDLLARDRHRDRAAFERIAQLSDGRIPSAAALRRVLAGLPGSNSPARMSHAASDDAAVGGTHATETPTGTRAHGS